MDSTGKTDKLPDGLIDRAVDTALTAMWGDGYEGVEDDVREALWAAAPLLVEHGAERERVKWEARIEKLATWEDRARAEQGKVARWLEESGSKMAREVREDEYRHAYTGRVLRSLLTEGKEA